LVAFELELLTQIWLLSVIVELGEASPLVVKAFVFALVVMGVDIELPMDVAVLFTRLSIVDIKLMSSPTFCLPRPKVFLSFLYAFFILSSSYPVSFANSFRVRPALC